MNKATIIHTLAVSLFACVLATGQTLCSTATLKGNYGLQITGTRPAPAVLAGIQATPGTTEQVVGVVVQTFDGAGGFSQIDNVKGSLSGIVPNRAGAGTYSVNPDCTGVFTVNNAGSPPIVNQFVIADNGQSILTAVTSPQAVLVTATGRKMSYLASCPVNDPPTLTAVVDSGGATAISAKATIIVWGQGFTPSGGNTLVFKRSGYADVVLSEAGGPYYWDYSGAQINASLNSLLSPGVWTLTVHNACSGAPSNSLSITIG